MVNWPPSPVHQHHPISAPLVLVRATASIQTINHPGMLDLGAEGRKTIQVTDKCAASFLCAAERKRSLGRDYHPLCLKCQKCSRQLTAGQHAEVKKKKKRCLSRKWHPESMNSIMELRFMSCKMCSYCFSTMRSPTAHTATWRGLVHEVGALPSLSLSHTQSYFLSESSPPQVTGDSVVLLTYSSRSLNRQIQGSRVAARQISSKPSALICHLGLHELNYSLVVFIMMLRVCLVML